jgi:hydrophobic/amphiphilic exporter-1 (mainly G- bacteria), HAE1 family
MLIGMATKNSILIVEFANQLREEGLSITKAAVESAKERLRPILMTAFSTVAGGVPLMVATGPGAAARQSLGTATFGGMCIATVLSLFVIPILYIIIKTGETHFRRGPYQPVVTGVPFNGSGPSSGYSDDGKETSSSQSPGQKLEKN